jgi:hypothetical protein
MAAGPQPRLPAATEGTGFQMEAGVDLPVGVKGEGPYFNARATRLGLAGLSLRSPEALSVGQRLRLTIFVSGEPLEVTGNVVAANATSADGQAYTVDVAFEPLREIMMVLKATLAQHTMSAFAARDRGWLGLRSASVRRPN